MSTLRMMGTSLILPLAMMLAGCSAILDTDSLQEGGDDAAPYDISASYKGMRAMPDRTLALASDTDFAFRWAPLPGQPNGYDLALQVGGTPALQVFARKGSPFARLGLSVVPLQSNDTYRVKSRRIGDKLRIQLYKGERELARHLFSAGRLGLLVAPAVVGGSRVQVALRARPSKGRKLALLLP